MKKFIYSAFLFSLPLLIAAASLFCFPVKRIFSYHYLPLDCENRAAWIYKRIFEDTTPADIVFLGSSHTMTGIDDEEMEKQFEQSLQKKIKIVNLGYCRFGDDLPYVLLKDVFKTKKPQIIVLEVREDVGTASHPVYPFLAENDELLHPPSFVNLSCLPNVYNGWLLRLAALRATVFQLQDSTQVLPYSHFGFRKSDVVADAVELEKAKQKRQQDSPSQVFRNVLQRYPLAWTTQLIALTKEYGAQIYFLYLPAFGNAGKLPEAMKCWKGENFILPPAAIFNQTKNWRDPDHLNNSGAEELSDWMVGQLKVVK